MKITKRLLVLLLVFLLSLSFAACGGDGSTPCTEHTDEDGNLICDICEATLEDNGEADGGVGADGELSLIANGKANFRIVKGANISAEANKKIGELKRNLGLIGIEIDVVYESDPSTMACEVLVGEVTTRGEDCAIDKHTLGPEGYIVKKVGTKIVLLGGSEDALADAVDAFISKILGYKASTESLTTVTMKDNDSIIKPQENFRVSSVKINGVDLKGYTIAVDRSNEAYFNAAKNLQEILYSKAGYWLDIVSTTNADKSIIIKSVENAGTTGFRVYVNDKNQLLVECAYDNMFEKAFQSFVATTIEVKFAPINFKNTKGVVHTEMINSVYYDDFGAKGDGVTNDFFAMKDAHDFANISGQTVYATPGKNYLISNTAVGKDAAEITIMSNTVWTGATITIDDRNISSQSGTKEYSTNIFVVKPTKANYSLSADDLTAINSQAITRDTKKLNITFDTDVLLLVQNANHKNYIRYSSDANNGQNQKEIIYVYADGTVSDTTPFMHDFEEITHVEVTQADLAELTITGGEVVTRASQENTSEGGKGRLVYFARGISVSRSNTRLIGVKHKVTDELVFVEGSLSGVSYNGFFCGGFASHVTFEECTLSARKYYKLCGTYDFGSAYTNEIHLINCDMYNFYLPNGKVSTSGNAYWGVGGTNYCKNMEYHGCTLTRYDAHSGVYNGKIINCTVNMINLIGAGEMIIEDTVVVQNNTLITLRSDYGSTWNGTVKIKNVRLGNTDSAVTLVNTIWANHNFGYDCYFPNIEIDNLKLDVPVPIDFIKKTDYTQNANGTTYVYYALRNQTAHLPKLKDGVTDNVNIYVPPETITINDLYGYAYTFTALDTFFAQTDIKINGEPIERN